MVLYLAAETNIPDVVVDFIEVRLKNGEVVSLNWDESSIVRSDDGFEAKYKGVYFGDEYANGRINDLKDLQISDIGLYFESADAPTFAIKELLFEDNDQSLSFKDPLIPHDCSGMDGINGIPSEQVNVSFTKNELDLVKSALDVMGDQMADREGYSSGEVYWTLKEKLTEAERASGKHEPLDRIISEATFRTGTNVHPSDKSQAKDPQR